jgi:outer membrane protein assembly factor BamA
MEKKDILMPESVLLGRQILATNQIDLRFEITENNKFTVNSIKVRGNEKTKTIAIIRELALAPGETFDLLRMETSEARLRNTRFFEKVTLDDEPIASQDPELQNTKRNLVVDVKEGRTGHVSFGVGFSTLEKAMMFAEFRQGNFDIMKWRSPHRLQGDGQKFRLRLKLGSRSNEARLAIEEPWFLNRRVAAGFEVFREKSDYYSSYYDEMRAGFEVYFRKRLFELVEGRVFYSFEDVLIDDISTNAPQFIKTDEDANGEIGQLISKVGLTLSRDTRDSILFPKEGSIMSLKKSLLVEYLGATQIMGGWSCKEPASSKPLTLWSRFYRYPEELEPLGDLTEKKLMFLFLKDSSLAALTIFVDGIIVMLASILLRVSLREGIHTLTQVLSTHSK